jgi:threonine synthase
VHNLCACGSPLLARYDLELARSVVKTSDLAQRQGSLWRYHELLPVRDPANVVTLGEGMTPLVPLASYGAAIGVPRLVMKDEGLIPTGSFKARGAAVGVARARELGVRGIAMPTNGNAGAAWAAYAARAGLRSLIAMPADASEITRAECALAGAQLHLVRGLIGDAGRLVTRKIAAEPGSWFDAATLKEPYRIEGKKTMGLEIVEQLGWRTPDVIVYPTGGGVGLIGIHKALSELTAMGWLHGPLPRLVAVQSAGCAPIVRAFERGECVSEPWQDAHTIAFGLTVPKALGDFLILDALYETGGRAIAVTDQDLLQDRDRCAAADGALLCPEGAATLSAVRLLREQGWLTGHEHVVVLNTGAAAKYPQTMHVDPPVLQPTDSIP